LTHAVQDRRDALVAQCNSVRHQAESADQWLSEAERTVMEHLIGRLAGEVVWHDALLDRLPKIVADFQRPSQQTD
jgi:hypothetical protein